MNDEMIANRNRGKTCGKRLKKLRKKLLITNEIIAYFVGTNLTSAIIIALCENSSDNIALICSNTAGVLGWTGKNQT